MSPNNCTEPDLHEHGRSADGRAISLDRRLFMQLLVFDAGAGSSATWGRGAELEAACIESLAAAKVSGILYRDLNNPRGLGLLSYSEEPAYFCTELRQLLQGEHFASLRLRHELTMFGRTYSLGHERDLEETLLRRPIARAKEYPWAIWYPLRRSGAYEQLTSTERQQIMREHAALGHAYGHAGVATDIRLACHGLTTSDDDFIVALLGAELYPLSRLIQQMRQTKQTSQYLQKLGPFFVGRVIWRDAHA